MRKRERKNKSDRRINNKKLTKVTEIRHRSPQDIVFEQGGKTQKHPNHSTNKTLM